MKSLLRKAIVALVAAAMLAVSAGVLVVAAAFALYALVRAYLTAPGAAAVVALAAALLMAIAAFVLERGIPKPPKRAKGETDETLLHRLMTMAQQKPIIAAGALIGLAAMAIRNPALIAVLVKTLLDPKPKPPGRKA